MMPGGAYARHTGEGLLQSFLKSVRKPDDERKAALESKHMCPIRDYTN